MNIAFLYWVQKTDQELGRLSASLLKSIRLRLTCWHWLYEWWCLARKPTGWRSWGFILIYLSSASTLNRATLDHPKDRVSKTHKHNTLILTVERWRTIFTNVVTPLLIFLQSRFWIASCYDIQSHTDDDRSCPACSLVCSHRLVPLPFWVYIRQYILET